MKEKYINEQHGFWYIFGEDKEKGVVDISTSAGMRDIAWHIPRIQAENLIREHNRDQRVLIEVCQSFDNLDSIMFRDFWYNERVNLLTDYDERNPNTWLQEMKQTLS